MNIFPGNPGPRTGSIIPVLLPVRDPKDERKEKRRKRRRRKAVGKWDGKIRIGE